MLKKSYVENYHLPVLNFLKFFCKYLENEVVNLLNMLMKLQRNKNTKKIAFRFTF